METRTEILAFLEQKQQQRETAEEELAAFSSGSLIDAGGIGAPPFNGQEQAVIERMAELDREIEAAQQKLSVAGE